MDSGRRRFFKTMAWSGAGFTLAPRKALSAGSDASDDNYIGGGFGFFSDDERKALGNLASVVLPGSRVLGAVDYIEQLLTAFDVDPPRIYAGGPYSGRTPFPTPQGTPSTNFPPNSFKEFLPLNRVQKQAWMLKLYGSKVVEGGAPNDAVLGKTRGLRDLFKDGLKQALKLSFGDTSKSAMQLVHPLLHSEFKEALQELVIESAYSAPEYGGNRGLKGWEGIHFEGDSLPLGYSMYDHTTGTYHERPEAPCSTENPGMDPDKMSFLTKLLFRGVCLILGRTFK